MKLMRVHFYPKLMIMTCIQVLNKDATLCLEIQHPFLFTDTLLSILSVLDFRYIRTKKYE